MAPEHRNRGLRPENAQQPMEPASSILAAHFAPLASQGHDAHRLPRETFSQLRQELLGERQSQSRVDEGITDINKLICIVLKAGLEVNPSNITLANDLQGQILDCLDIIQAGIEKAPQVLLESSDPLILGGEAPAPLYAWLIIRLIRLISLWTSKDIQERTHLILGAIINAQPKQARSSPSSYGIAAFLRACISGLSLSKRKYCGR